MSDIYNNDNNTVGNNFLGNAYAEVSLPYNLKLRTQFNSVIENSKYDWFLNPYNSLAGLTVNGEAKSNYSGNQSLGLG